MVILLDGAKVKSRKSLHSYLKKAFSFPDWYGRNLDALHDCLTDLHEDVELVLQNPEALEAELGFYAKSLLIVLRRAANENEHFHVTIQ